MWFERIPTGYCEGPEMTAMRYPWKKWILMNIPTGKIIGHK
jgi:hypothetical protein